MEISKIFYYGLFVFVFYYTHKFFIMERKINLSKR